MKGPAHRIFKYGQIAALMWLLWNWPVCSVAQAGSLAPGFTLKDIHGESHSLSALARHPMVMLYFFDADSKPSHAGLIALDQLRTRYRQADLVVWAITQSGRDKVKRFVDQNPIRFPVLLDAGAVSRHYQADRILPTTCLLGPDLRVLDILHGGGKSNEVLLERLAQRLLQQRKYDLARVVSEKVVQSHPENLDARLVGAYAALNAGKLEESEGAFARLAEQGGQAESAGIEGLSAVAARKGQVQKALALARQVEQADPDRGYVHVIKADLLYSRNKKQAAESEYRKAISKKKTSPSHRAKAFNQLARIQASQGRLKQAQALYDQAEDIDPYYIEATTNKGLVYEKQKSWDKALACYARVRNINPTDRFSQALQEKLSAMLELENNKAEKERIDALVKNLAARYRERQRTAVQAVQDTWSSRPMVLSIVDFGETGGLPERDGFAAIFATELADSLNGSGRVRVVERAIVEKLLQELNLGSSELADTASALELGKVLSAKIMITGSLLYRNGKYLLTLRLIDTETTRIADVISAEVSGIGSIRRDTRQLNLKILAAIIRQYPLQGFVVRSANDQVLINLGSGQGVVTGTRFDIVEVPAPIQYRGKQLQAHPKAIGQIEVVTVEPEYCQGRILHSRRPVATDDRLREKLAFPLLESKFTLQY